MLEELATAESPECLAYVQKCLREQTFVTEHALRQHGMNEFDAKLFGGRMVRLEGRGTEIRN